MRQEILMNENWLFHKGDIHVPRPTDKGPVYSQSKTERKLIGPAAYHYLDTPDPYRMDREIHGGGWERVSLPHDFIIDQDNDPTQNNAHGYFHYDNAWYRKHFSVGEEARGKRITLQFDGIAGVSTIYLNGCLMKHNYSSYNSFEVDVSDNVYFDRENILAVYDNTEEFEGWWYQGGGIYRDVRLVITEPVCIDLYGVYAPARKMEDGSWTVDFQTTVLNASYDGCAVSVTSQIMDREGNVAAVATGEGYIPLRDKRTVKYQAVVHDPELWDIEKPNLYTVKTTLYSGDEILDENITRIGFRTVEIHPDKGLFLNGKHTFINGLCCHQDFGLTGLAVPANIARYKIGLMKEMGANGFRTSHYMNSSANMDAFDEMGFLVMNETRWFESTQESMEQLEALVKRDRNRPSVIMWSTSNEEAHHTTDVGPRIHKAMAARIRQLDNTRFVVAAQSHSPDQSTIFEESDLIGINYNHHLFDVVRSRYPNKPIFSSENCATGTIRDWHFPSDLNGRIRDKDRDTNSSFLARESFRKFFDTHPYIFGSFQWAAVEHRGEAMWPVVCSKSGAIDLFLQKKGAFYQNQSHWLEKAMVHIVPHWNFRGLEGKEILVTVYTNCDELELFVNGCSRGRKQIEKYGHGEWNVPYEPGVLSVKAYREGKLVAEDVRRTTKKAVKLALRLENQFEANGQDLALFTCQCLDEDGEIVPDASEFVRFSAEEPAVIVGTGSDNADHNRVTLAQRQMYMGKIAVAVRPAKGQEKLTLYAMSDHCGVCSITV